MILYFYQKQFFWGPNYMGLAAGSSPEDLNTRPGRGSNAAREHQANIKQKKIIFHMH